MSKSGGGFQVLIVGAGVAGLEAALALRDLAGDRVTTTLLEPEANFTYRPLRVKAPFGLEAAKQYPVEEIARDIGFELLHDRFKWLDRESQVVHTDGGEQLPYDALLLAMGARLRPAFAHAITIDDSVLDEQLHGLIQDVEGGYVRSIAFLSPSAMPWPLPIYELALMTARRAFDMQVDVAITIATPEDSPLAIFGLTASQAVQGLLEKNGITVIGSAHCSVPEARLVVVHPGEQKLRPQRIVALPQLFGPSIPGVPTGTSGGFIPVDPHGQVQHLDGVFAAGDATNFPIKHGGIAAQQADTAAMAIAARAGASVKPEKFNPKIHAMLLGADKPLYLSAHVTGGHGSSSEVSDHPSWSSGTKIAAKYLGPYLETRERQAAV